MLWWVGIGLIVAWSVLHFVANKTGLVHLFLLSGISVLFVQVLAYRKTKHQERVSGRSRS
jgi:hypothetical protein